MHHKIIDNLFIFFFALLLSMSILYTISIIRAHASWGAEHANADLGVQAWYQGAQLPRQKLAGGT